MYGKTPTTESRAILNQPTGLLNPMFGKKPSDSKKRMNSKKRIHLSLERLSKHSQGVGIYDLDDNVIIKFKNNVELANHLNISKVTVGKY